MSKPETTSGLSVDAPASSGYRIAGRRLANKFRFLRNPRIACSGRKARSKLSYFQSPTEPNKIASASCASFRVASGNGCPEASYPAPPTGAISISKDSPRAFNTFTACSTISGPIPSPGKIAIFMFSINKIK